MDALSNIPESLAFLFYHIIDASKSKISYFKLSNIINLFLQAIFNNPINGLIFNQILIKGRGF